MRLVGASERHVTGQRLLRSSGSRWRRHRTSRHHRRVQTSHQAPEIAAPLPDVTTERLDLRRFHSDDLDELSKVFAHREVWQFPYGRGFSRSETEHFLDAQIAEWDEIGFGCWVARTKDDGSIIGYVGLSVPTFLPAVEVGWRFAPSAWGKGYATEGAAVALDQGFLTMGLSRICSVPQADNPRSVLVAERLGMQLVDEVNIPGNERRGELTALLYEIDCGAWRQRRPTGVW